MRMTTMALAALCCAPALTVRVETAWAQKARVPTAPAAVVPVQPDEPDAPAQSEEGGAGYLPGARFQRKLDGGPGFVCTATNALHDQQCTASCQKGETADCVDADGGATPSCQCTKG